MFKLDEYLRPHRHRIRAKVFPGPRTAEFETEHDHPALDYGGLKDHTHKGLGPARMTEENRKRRQSDAGRKDRGPRVRAKAGERRTSDGYKIPKGYTGREHAFRNRAILQLDRDGWPVIEIALAFRISESTVRFVRRYFDPEGGEEVEAKDGAV